jgi:hypothetical protein
MLPDVFGWANSLDRISTLPEVFPSFDGWDGGSWAQSSHSSTVSLAGVIP